MTRTDASCPRPLAGIYPPGPEHWVGDGFFVRTVFWPQRDADALSPFLLLDHGARRVFPPSRARRGVGAHPHRGFETVTFVYEGGVEHRDSGGGGGRIDPGDVQWMTAGAGVVHEEFHAPEVAAAGGAFELVQLWVNLPAALKTTPPTYQALPDAAFPRVELGAAVGRLVAGTLPGARGPARTHSPMTVFDLTFHRDGELRLAMPDGWTTVVFAMGDGLRVGPDAAGLSARHFALFDRAHGGAVRVVGARGARALWLAGAPLGEPVAAHGPFVMNTREELVRAFQDYQAGRMGQLP